MMISAPQPRKRRRQGWDIALFALLILRPTASALASDPWGSAAQIPRDEWKDCAFNGAVIGCSDTPLPNGLRIVWKDGLRMTYVERPPRQPGDPVYLTDTLGGLWRRELLVQGNTVLTNLENGNRIFVPLRFACKPPLKGEVGACRH